MVNWAVIYVGKRRDVTQHSGINPKVFPLVDTNLSLTVVERTSGFVEPWS